MEKKLSALSQLIQLAKVDGELHPEEIKFIHNLGRQMGISDERMIDTIENPAPFEPFKNEMDRIVQFQRMALLIHVDGKVTKEEIETIKSIGILLGLNPKATSEVLEMMSKYPNNIVPPKDLIAVYKKHYN